MSFDIKYIDAERLQAFLQKKFESYKSGMVDPSKYPIDHIDLMALLAREYQALILQIGSLQQEQLPGIEEYGVPGKDFIPVEWVDACEKYGKWKIVQQEPKMDIPSAGSGAMGTTPPKFKLDVKQDLPVGLEKEIQEYLEKLGGGHGGFVDDLTDDDLTGLALHFYGLGLNARKEK